MKKLKLNKKFQALPRDDGDEFYPNGIFVFNITKLLSYIEKHPDLFPIEYVEVKCLNKIPSPNLDEATIQSANLAAPIILGEIAPGGFNVIDGNHRVERASRDGLDRIPAYRVLVDQHIAFLTSEQAYRTYVGYWNSKIDSMEL